MTADLVGAPRPRPDTPAKVRGATRYASDRPIRGLLHARLVLAPRAHARIVSIEREAALAVPGVVAVLTAADLPLKGEGSDRLSRPLATSEVVFAGEPVALVVGRTPQAAADGAELVEVRLQAMPSVVDTEAAMVAASPLARVQLAEEGDRTGIDGRPDPCWGRWRRRRVDRRGGPVGQRHRPVSLPGRGPTRSARPLGDHPRGHVLDLVDPPGLPRAAGVHRVAGR